MHVYDRLADDLMAASNRRALERARVQLLAKIQQAAVAYAAGGARRQVRRLLELGDAVMRPLSDRDRAEQDAAGADIRRCLTELDLVTLALDGEVLAEQERDER